MAERPPLPWQRALTALALLAIDPRGLGGLTIRARSGPVRDLLTAQLGLLPTPLVRVPPTTATDQLAAGIDIAATLATDRVVDRAGLLSGAATLLLPMSDRLRPDLAARLAQVMDDDPICAVALDEGIDDEGLPLALLDRLAFCIDLDAIRLADASSAAAGSDAIAAARARLPAVTCTAEQIAQITLCADRLGVVSLRAAQFTLRAARAHAALAGRTEVDIDDLIAAIDLVLSHRATRIPEGSEDAPQDDAPDETEGDAQREPTDTAPIPDEMLLEAVAANLPPGLLDRLASRSARRGRGTGSGERRKGNRRGRPLPARPGRLDGIARIDLIATLRAAAPWQTIRAKTAARPAVIHIRPSDIHLKRFEQKSDRLLIFTVDASGSAAFARLAEAKGAVELLLSEAYARRDQVALIAFRGTGAEILLPPTRSLVQTKRRLASLPGGGGTPLAAGLLCAMELATTARARGLTPTIALLTDGRANITLDGTASRADAMMDAQSVARTLVRQGCDAIVIDMGNRPEPELARLCEILRGVYLPLPRADARRLSGAVAAILDD